MSVSFFDVVGWICFAIVVIEVREDWRSELQIIIWFVRVCTPKEQNSTRVISG